MMDDSGERPGARLPEAPPSPTSPAHRPVRPTPPVEPGFSAEEYDRRARLVREEMERRGLQALMVTGPENIYYLTGLSHQGYFAFTLLVFRLEGDNLIVTRTMERATIAEQAPNLMHVGFRDDEWPADGATRALEAAGLGAGTVGVEQESMFFPIRTWEHLHVSLPKVRWENASGLVDRIRMVKSPPEISYIRQAAALSDRAVRAATLTAGVGVRENEVAADVYHAMVTGGSEYPGFAPLVRSTDLLLHEHTTWRERTLTQGDGLFMELSASVNRYHAPVTRMIHMGRAPDGIARSADIVLEGLDAVTDNLRPGAVTGDVYAAWQKVVDDALGHDGYRRHHCGYTVGIGFPPSWVGGSSVVGIRPGGKIEIREGMVFHVLSWLFKQEGFPDYAVSDTVLVTDRGCELLTSTKRTPTVIS